MRNRRFHCTRGLSEAWAVQISSARAEKKKQYSRINFNVFFVSSLEV